MIGQCCSQVQSVTSSSFSHWCSAQSLFIELPCTVTCGRKCGACEISNGIFICSGHGFLSRILENCPHCRHVSLQYVSAIQAELLKKHVLSIETSEGTFLSRSQCNMRLASEKDSARLTGFVHNAVSPVGLSEALPIIVASEIANLQFVWLGGGEPDLKLGMSVPQFVAAYKAAVINVSNQNRTVDEV